MQGTRMPESAGHTPQKQESLKKQRDRYQGRKPPDPRRIREEPELRSADGGTEDRQTGSPSTSTEAPRDTDLETRLFISILLPQASGMERIDWRDRISSDDAITDKNDFSCSMISISQKGDSYFFISLWFVLTNLAKKCRTPYRSPA